MKKFFLFCLILIIPSVFAYTPSGNFSGIAQRLSSQLNRMVQDMDVSLRNEFLNTVSQRLILLQNNLVGKTDTRSLDRNFLLEYLRRNITTVGSFEKEDIIYDDLASIIWTYAPRGFDILYSPYETSSVQNRDTDKKYSTLLNGGYFNRIDGSLYQA